MRLQGIIHQEEEKDTNNSNRVVTNSLHVFQKEFVTSFHNF